MKKLLFIALILNFSIAFAQIDTLNYVKQFEINKEKYIGKPFSVLLNDMKKIKPNLVLAAFGFNNKHVIIGSYFCFGKREDLFKEKKMVTLTVRWKNPLPKKEAVKLIRENDFYFNNELKKYYSNKIIEKISVVFL